ncbi:MAG: exodeoxyribonuclease V subunit gamma [Bacteroidales bacterium]|nr:exodeoxyribonuclease V subunit gamma [Bacteroidales bacterium]
MNSFLRDCAEDILSKYDNDNSVCMVFPNKRTMLYFRTVYAKLKRQVSFSGHMFPINKVWQQFLKTTVADDLTLLFQLFDAFQQVFNHQGMLNQGLAADFNRFFDTGQRLVADFNEIDNYLVDINQLCHNCADLNEIDAYFSKDFPEEYREIIKTFWRNFSPDHISKEKQRFMELWINLPKVYNIFKQNLEKLGAGYSGMNNRKICQLIDDGNLKTRFKTYIFIGFNVLNKAERKIFKHLRDSKNAKFYWDADSYYISDKAQEAGLFMREYLDEYPDERGRNLPDNILHSPKEVEYIGVPLQVGQAKAVHQLLTGIIKSKNDKNSNIDGNENPSTAIVLGDEHLLFPVLDALPDDVKKVNVTMGYPFIDTPVYSFLNCCMQIMNNGRDNGDTIDYYYKDVLAVINHPLVAKIPEFKSKLINQEINEQRMIRVNSGYFRSFPNILNIIFLTDRKTPADLVKNFMDILAELYFLMNPRSKENDYHLPETVNKPINEFIYQAYIALKQFYNNILQLNLTGIDDKLIINIVKQHMSQIKVAFDSEDNDGVQIIGMMETRNIDFDNVILLGMNEGVFPKRSENNSFITEGMRLAFDMPITKYKDAVFAYFFYRLFQRAKNIKLLYNNVFSFNVSGEPSRFATQILKEASSEICPGSQMNINQSQFLRFIKPISGKAIELRNSEKTLAKLKELAAYRFTPSALNTFLDCPLKYYLTYIAGIREIEELDEESSAADFGSILHGAIEDLYTNIKDVNGMISAKAIDDAKPELDSYILTSYNKVFKERNKSQNDLSGFNNIFFHVVRQYLDRILEYDKTKAPFQLKEAEGKVKTSITILVDGKPFAVNIGGTIDRVDLVNNVLRIVDYKTGNMEGKMTFKSIDSLFEGGDEKRSTQAFQVLLYSYVYMQLNPQFKPMPVIYGVRDNITDDNSRFGLKPDKVVEWLTPDNIQKMTDDFILKLKVLLENIFSKDQKFDACKNQNICKNCKYSDLCGHYNK